MLVHCIMRAWQEIGCALGGGGTRAGGQVRRM
jgi:hypothetical protein